MVYPRIATPEEFFRALHESYQQASSSCAERPSQCFRIASRQVHLFFAGNQLVEPITHGLRHLLTSQLLPPDLQIYLFDTVSTQTELPFSWYTEALHGRLVHYSNAEISSFYHFESNALMTVNARTNQAVYWIRDISLLHPLERCIPLRTIFHCWFKYLGIQLLHAAAIGSAKTGALLVGQANSGKSTTALLSLHSNFSCAGDDFVLFGLDPQRSYSLCQTVKLTSNSLSLIKEKLPQIIPSPVSCGEKIWIDLHDNLPNKLATDLPINAILLPRLNLEQSQSRLEPIAPFQALVQIAPSTVIPVAGADQADLRHLAELSRQVPAALLSIGNDNAQLCDLLAEYLEVAATE